MNVVPSVILFIKAVEDGKITGRELKQILITFIPDDWEFSLKEVIDLLKSVFKKAH